MSTTPRVVWTSGAEQALKDDQALIDKVGGGDFTKAKQWHDNKVTAFVGQTPAVQIATKASIRYGLRHVTTQ